MENLWVAVGHVEESLVALRLLLQSTPSFGQLTNWYWTADPLASALVICALLIVYVYVGSILTHDYSFVDRQWSLLPVAYAWHFYLHSDGDARLLLAASCITIWGLRLTYNFARKGGYSGMEDYRWAEIRKTMHPVAFQVLNLFFIAICQELLLLSLLVPLYYAHLFGQRGDLTTWDYGVAGLLCALILLETVADQQQWNYQQAKHRHIKEHNGKAVDAQFQRGFIVTGLFRFSRHPNFFAEQSIWWTVYLFSVVATGAPLNPTILAPFCLSLLFQGSTNLTEELSLKKYPLYALYQKTTSRLIPLPPRSSSSSSAGKKSE
eukprot:m.70631 g.70631  ORF g.70631 m.70631 type:complete len:321 (+) comp14312_c0_seq1:39-1001(+)